MSKQDVGLMAVLGLRPFHPPHGREASGYYELDADVRIMPRCPKCGGVNSHLGDTGIRCPDCGFGVIWKLRERPQRKDKKLTEVMIAEELMRCILPLGAVMLLLLMIL